MATQERFRIEKKCAARSFRRARCPASVSGPFPWILTLIVSMFVTFIHTCISSGASMALSHEFWPCKWVFMWHVYIHIYFCTRVLPFLMGDGFDSEYLCKIHTCMYILASVLASFSRNLDFDRAHLCVMYK